MPHLLIERLRSLPALNPSCCKESTLPWHDLFIGVTELLASLIFVIGSVCFLPEYEHDLRFFVLGCILFVVGSVMYLLISLFTMAEAIHRFKAFSTEVLENMLYVLGSFVFAVGTLLYWPEKAKYEHIELFKDYTLGQYFNLFSPEFEGTLLFITGSVMFAFAAFTNALNHRKLESDMNYLLTLVTSIDMGADILFVMGSVAFLPDLGCNSKMVFFGAWCFIWGSLLFVIGASISIYRTIRLWRMKENQVLLTPDQSPMEQLKSVGHTEAPEAHHRGHHKDSVSQLSMQ